MVECAICTPCSLLFLLQTGVRPSGASLEETPTTALPHGSETSNVLRQVNKAGSNEVRKQARCFLAGNGFKELQR